MSKRGKIEVYHSCLISLLCWTNSLLEEFKK